MICETIEDSRNLERHTGPHQNVSHAREHGAVDGRQMRELHFLQVIDSDRMVVALAGEKDFDKMGGHAKLLKLARSVLGMRGQGLVGRSLRLSAGNVVRLPNTLGDFGNRKMIETAAHVAAGIAVLQTPGKNRIQGRSGNYAQLAEFGNGLRQPPTGYPGTHSALNNGWKIAHDKPATEYLLFQNCGIRIV